MLTQIKLLNWNVRGLNDRARRSVVRDLAVSSGCSILCIQESKLAPIRDSEKTEIAGQALNGYTQLTVDGTRGGILLFWNEDIFDVQIVRIANFSITAKLTEHNTKSSWTLTTVYGPADDERKLSFLQELVDLHAHIAGPWMVIGDFNLILRDQDKNKRRVNRTWMRRFRNAVDSSCLREIKLIGRRYTWSNEHSDLTLVRLDRAFCNDDWDELFQSAKLLPQASSMSDHCPLILVQDVTTRMRPRSRFESFWPLLEGYSTVVEQSWNAPCRLTNQFAVLDLKLKRLAKDLKTWAKNYVGDIRKQTLLGQEIMLRLDTTQETRSLTVEEHELRSVLKTRAVGLAVINRIKAKQRARVKWLQLGDANTKFFHSRASHRKQKNRIQSLQSESGIATTPSELEETTFHHLNAIMGTSVQCTERFDWARLNLPTSDLSDLDVPFSLEELKRAVFDTPTDKAPGPDGFSGGFFRTSWNVIKEDLLRALNKFYNLNDPSFDKLNTAFFILLPKNDQPSQMKHYRPISLIHAFGKLVSKTLALRLKPHLESSSRPAKVRSSAEGTFRTTFYTCKMWPNTFTSLEHQPCY
jgi:exonuclease III